VGFPKQKLRAIPIRPLSTLGARYEIGEVVGRLKGNSQISPVQHGQPFCFFTILRYVAEHIDHF
jgi:hypothetical protein